MTKKKYTKTKTYSISAIESSIYYIEKQRNKQQQKNILKF